VWIYGNLNLRSENKPDCAVFWNWHVVPTLAVQTPAGVETYVIDPALFSRPVPQTTWAAACGDPSAVPVPTSGEVFYRDRGGGSVTDPSYDKTKRDLDSARTQLRYRSAYDGVPPYPGCRTALPSGVKWAGTLAPNATDTWTSPGRPASAHILWSVVPTSICGWSPQPAWSVAVGRDSGPTCTYWFTATIPANATQTWGVHSWPSNWHTVWYLMPVSPTSSVSQPTCRVEVCRASTSQVRRSPSTSSSSPT
jgi:hypothetical protein